MENSIENTKKNLKCTPCGKDKHVKGTCAKQFKQTKHLGETLGELGEQTSQALLCLLIVNGLLGKLRQAAWLRNRRQSTDRPAWASLVCSQFGALHRADSIFYASFILTQFGTTVDMDRNALQ